MTSPVLELCMNHERHKDNFMAFMNSADPDQPVYLQSDQGLYHSLP